MFRYIYLLSLYQNKIENTVVEYVCYAVHQLKTKHSIVF